MAKVPHVIPYQGSKRKLANQILDLVDFKFDTLYEPFCGSSAITLAAACRRLGSSYVISDKLESLACLWKLIIEEPEVISERYRQIWEGQFEQPIQYYNEVRERFNLSKDPALLLFLITRCVKNAVRFNPSGDFNQSADKRRSGTNPSRMRDEIIKASALLRRKTKILAGDYHTILTTATSNDLVYMDPPYQGTSQQKKDTRYAFILDFDNLVDTLSELNDRNVPYLLSFDGSCGQVDYGKPLPDSLNLKRILLNAGRSSQATLLGRDDVTIESLYLSPAFIRKTGKGSESRLPDGTNQLSFAI